MTETRPKLGMVVAFAWFAAYLVITWPLRALGALPWEPRWVDEVDAQYLDAGL